MSLIRLLHSMSSDVKQQSRNKSAKVWRLVKLKIDRARVFFARIFLPGSCYIQHTPDFIRVFGRYPDFKNGSKKFTNKLKNNLGDANRWIMINMFLDYMSDVEGAYGELGTYRGGIGKSDI